MTQPTILSPPPADSNWAPPGWGPPAAPIPPAPPAKRKGWLILGIIALFFFIVGVAGASDTKDTDSSDGVAVSTPTTASSASSSGSASSSLLSWINRHGTSDSSVLSTDLNALAAAAGTMDTDSMISSCRTFQRHLNNAESHLPTPDAQLTSALGSAYRYFGQANTACILGISSMDPDQLGEMSAYVQMGTASLKTATARLEALS